MADLPLRPDATSPAFGLLVHGLQSDALLPPTITRMCRGKDITVMHIPDTGHTPLLADRYVALKAASYIYRAARGIDEEFVVREDGKIAAIYVVRNPDKLATLGITFTGMPIAFALGAVAVLFMAFCMPAAHAEFRMDLIAAGRSSRSSRPMR